MPDSNSIARRQLRMRLARMQQRKTGPNCVGDPAAPRSNALGCAARLGKMGLNGGPQDADNLAGKLARVLVDSAPDSLRDLYNRQRRTVAVDFVQEQSIANNERLEAKYPEARRRNFEDLAAIAVDRARARQYLLRSSVLARQARVTAMTPEAAP
jgi:3-(3-hydroxy-phenyl)propionate hydroxylase